MFWGSYVSVLLQLFIIIPLIVILYKFNKKLAYIFVYLLLFSGTTICIFVIYTNNFIPGYLYIFDITVFDEYGIKPYTRIDSLSAGILLGFYY